MRRRLLVGLCLGLAAGCSAAAPQIPAPGAAAPVLAGTLGRSSVATGIDLYRRVAAEERGNIALSPISLMGAMAPVAAGARGATRSAIDTAMRFPRGDVLAPSGALIRSLAAKRAGGRVDIANGLWLAKDFKPNPMFVAAVRDQLDAEVAQIDFADGRAAANRINGWASAKTEGRIPHVIDPPFDRTRLVVTNAVYLLADWADKFDAKDTAPADFFAAAAMPVQARLMHRIGSYRLIEDSDLQILDLPYADGRLAMSVMLPRRRDGLAELERRLGGDWLHKQLSALDAAPLRMVDVRLPKVEFSGSFSLKPMLIAMGMGLAFSDAADLDGIAGESLAISRVLQSSFLRIDEKGTEAAAVTAVEVVVTGARNFDGPTFRADHPMLFVLRDRPTGALLFIGRIADPAAR